MAIETKIKKFSVALMTTLSFLSTSLYAAAPPALPTARLQVGDQPPLPEDGCVYAGLGYSDRVFISVPPAKYQCRAQHWFLAPDAASTQGMSPADFMSSRTQAPIAGDGCIYAGLGFSDGAIIQTDAGNYLCKSHHWDGH